MTKAVVVLSGGMDSATLLALALAEGFEVHALSFNYGQRHSKELESAKAQAEAAGIVHHVVDLPITDLLGGSALTDDIDVPEGHYADENMKLTVVPNRNAIMLSIAMGYAVSIKAPLIFFGAHAGDHAIYPDCRPEFVGAMNMVGKLANYEIVTVRAPFIDMDKGQIAALGLKLGVDYAKTWTCYKGGEVACGKCGSCTERLEAFEFAGIEDPIEYQKESKIIKP